MPLNNPHDRHGFTRLPRRIKRRLRKASHKRCDVGSQIFEAAVGIGLARIMFALARSLEVE